MRRIMRKIVDGEGDQLGDLSTLAESDVVDTITVIHVTV
jgi:acetyl-CoA synthetase